MGRDAAPNGDGEARLQGDQELQVESNERQQRVMLLRAGGEACTFDGAIVSIKRPACTGAREATTGHGLAGCAFFSLQSSGNSYTRMVNGAADDYVSNTTVTALNTSHGHYDRHYHYLLLDITIPAFTLSVPNHTHDLPAHTHGDNPGIYRGSTASSVVVTVDGTTVPASVITNNEFNAVPYLSKDDGGKITRGTWHTITIKPNSMTRIVGDIHVKTFVRSQGGGDY